MVGGATCCHRRRDLSWYSTCSTYTHIFSYHNGPIRLCLYCIVVQRGEGQLHDGRHFYFACWLLASGVRLRALLFPCLNHKHKNSERKTIPWSQDWSSTSSMVKTKNDSAKNLSQHLICNVLKCFKKPRQNGNRRLRTRVTQFIPIRLIWDSYSSQRALQSYADST